MPYLKIKVNQVSTDYIVNQVVQEVTTAIQEIKGDDPNMILVVVEPGLHVAFGGDLEKPAAAVDFTAIGFTSELTAKLTAKISDILLKYYSVDPKRIYISFEEVPQPFYLFGWNRTNFEVIFQNMKKPQWLAEPPSSQLPTSFPTVKKNQTMVTYTSNKQDPLEKGAWVTLKHSELIPLNVDYFWSAFDDYLEFLMCFSGRTDVELETDNNKPANGPGAIVHFEFEGYLVRDRLLDNDKEAHIWRMDIPEATPLYTLYIVTFTASAVSKSLTEVSIQVQIVMQSEERSDREEALNTLLTYIPKRIPEIIRLLEKRDGGKFELAPLGETEVRDLASNFFRDLDTHADPAVFPDYLALDSSDFEMRFPNGTIHNQTEYDAWYKDSIEVYFDELHQIKEIHSIKELEGGKLEIDLIIHWEASTWSAPDAKSVRIVADVKQKWTVLRSAQTYKPQFEKYIVEGFVG